MNAIISSKLLEINVNERSYKPTSLCLMFFLFSFLGWVWEVFVCIIEYGRFINRGVMTGPWLPLYGISGILILILFKKICSSPLFLFCSVIFFHGCLEYISSLVLETLFGARWWDYSDMLLDIQGRTSLNTLLIFATISILVFYIGAPKLDELMAQISHRKRFLICHLLVFLFAINLVASLFSPNMGSAIIY